VAVVSLTRKAILVVEDDDALRNMLESLFLLEGFNVRGATDGTQALRLVNEHPPDLIVLDLMLPWVNGIEVLSTVRQHPHLSNVPVLVTTGTVTSALDLRSLGPVHVMHKPLDVEAIVPIVRKLLEHSDR
jgi:DNA-binding response OmpR family regulator